MNFIHLIFIVCAAGSPDRCEEKRLPLINETNVQQCVFDAPLVMAEWAGSHPDWNITHWHCARPSAEGEKT